MSFVSLFFGLQYIADIVYTAVLKRNYNPSKFKAFLDVMIFLIFMINIIITFAVNLRLTIVEGPNVVTWEEKAPKFCRNFVENPLDETNMLIIGVVVLWMRVINFARYNEHLGKYLGVVKRLMSELVLFFVIYLVNLIFFATLAESSFTDLAEYNTV